MTVVGIVGAGVMGRQIARYIQTAAARLAGAVSVTLCSRSAESTAKAQRANRGELAALVAGGKMSERDAVALASSLIWTRHIDDLIGADIVLECIVEDRVAKRQLFEALDDRLGGDTILASNTSSIEIWHMAAAARRHPSRVIGIHFVNPVHAIDIVELIPATHYTAPDVVTRAGRFLESIGKEAIPVPDSKGFVINRVMFAGILAALEILDEGGIDAATIDRLSSLGRPGMGPLAMADYIGLDVCGDILEQLTISGPPPVLLERVAAGKLGRKTGEGFFTYGGAADFGKRTAVTLHGREDLKP